MVGYSETPLIKKSGIKAHHKVYLKSAPAKYRKLFCELPEGVLSLDSYDW